MCTEPTSGLLWILYSDWNYWSLRHNFKTKSSTSHSHSHPHSHSENALGTGYLDWARKIDKNVVRIWNLFKVVQHVAATNVALKIFCRRQYYSTYRLFVQQYCALKIVVKDTCTWCCICDIATYSRFRCYYWCSYGIRSQKFGINVTIWRNVAVTVIYKN